jgi:hypothetical protein
MASTRSRSGALLVGQAPPRVRHAPSVRANSWEDVADLSASLGVTLDEWQETVLQVAMGERSDGRWAARLIGVSAPRQQGKSQLIVARALAGILLFEEETIICSAHQTDTAREVFQRLLDIIESNPSLERRVDSVMKAINREHIRFKTGQTIRIKARSIAGGRGFSCDCLLLDEAQILGASSWSAILPTMSARENPQAWLLGTPPTPQDDGEVFARIRQSALTGKDARLAYVEWAADPDDDIDDPDVWAKANPALGTRISLEAVESERAAMTDQQFAMERLGVWEQVKGRSVIPPQSWVDAADPVSLAVDRYALGVECGPDLACASVALSGQRADGDWHLELEADQHTHGAGTAWLVPHVEAIVAANPQIRAVMVDVAGPIAALLEQRQDGRWFFKDARLEVTPIRVTELGAACSLVLDGVVTGWLHHIGQPQLSTAALSAGKRALGDTGKWVWSRKSSTSDITPIQAATLALAGAQSSAVKKPSRSGEGRRAALVL